MARPRGYRTVGQLGRYCGVTTEAVKAWYKNGDIPKPEIVHHGTKLWSTEQAREILAWHQRKAEAPQRRALPPTALMLRGKDPQR